jgi:hypothetical protein
MGRRFSTLRPGPRLSRRLAAVRLADVPDDAVPDLLHAEVRQLANQQARVWAAMAEVYRRAPLELSPDQRFDFAVDQIVAELLVSRLAAERELEHALTLNSLPALAAALRSGQLDRSRTVMLLEVLTHLTPDHREKLLAEVLPDAASVTVATLRARVQRVAMALDPAWAEQRYRKALRRQKVVRYLNEDGTVTLSAENLSAEEALAAYARLTAVAWAAKRAGAHATLDRLRAALCVGLFDGRFEGFHAPQIIAALVAQFPKPESDVAATAVPESTVESGVELRVGIATLMGLDEKPGEVAGFGPVIAPVARSLAERQRRGEWRYAIVDGDGRALATGLTRHRPTGDAAAGRKGGIVELHVPEYLLDPAFIEEHPAWAKLLTDLARQYERQSPIEQDPAARLPGRQLRRHVQIRHRCCVFPGCRRPAAEAQADHRLDWSKHGPTVEANLGALCQRHHTLKTQGGWRLLKTDEITYQWVSPLGRRHLVKIEPVAPPLPSPPDSDTA